MLDRKKIRLLVIGGITLLALFFLSLGLSQTRLLPGEKINLGTGASLAGQYSTFINGNILVKLIQIFYFMSAAADIILLIYMLLNPKRRKQLGRILLSVTVSFAILLFLASLIRSCNGSSNLVVVVPTGVPPTPNGNSVPISTFTPNTSPWITLIASIILGVIIMIVVIVLIVRFQRGKILQTTPLMRLADQAQAALDKLEAGGDLKNIVLRCYYEMTKILLEKRSMKREKSMTPREFEVDLIAQGLPVEAVQMLTRLFEEVRYGSMVPGKREEWMATSSLTAIIDACQVKE